MIMLKSPRPKASLSKYSFASGYAVYKPIIQVKIIKLSSELAAPYKFIKTSFLMPLKRLQERLVTIAKI